MSLTTTEQSVDGNAYQVGDLSACDIRSGTIVAVGMAGPFAVLARVADTATEANVENDDATVADGRHLVLSTVTSLADRGPGADADSATDVYRYDAGKRGLLRIPTPSSGGGGNDSVLPGSQSRSGVMTADARTVILEAHESLSLPDIDAASGGYAWHGGCVSPITSGASGGVEQAGIATSRKNIFFLTSQLVIAADGDTNFAIFGERVGGGFDLTRPAAASRLTGNVVVSELQTGVPRSRTIKLTHIKTKSMKNRKSSAEQVAIEEGRS